MSYLCIPDDDEPSDDHEYMTFSVPKGHSQYFVLLASALSSHVVSNLYKILVRPTLKYACLVWSPHLAKGRPISLKIGTQSRHVELYNMPKFQVQPPFLSPLLHISLSGVPRG